MDGLSIVYLPLELSNVSSVKTVQKKLMLNLVGDWNINIITGLIDFDLVSKINLALRMHYRGHIVFPALFLSVFFFQYSLSSFRNIYLYWSVFLYNFYWCATTTSQKSFNSLTFHKQLDYSITELLNMKTIMRRETYIVSTLRSRAWELDKITSWYLYA